MPASMHHFELNQLLLVRSLSNVIKHFLCAKIKLQCDAIRWPGTFCGDVVLDNFNMSYRDEDSILDQKYEQQLFCVLSYEDLKSWKGLKKMHI